jgi:hypothetical protein
MRLFPRDWQHRVHALLLAKRAESLTTHVLERTSPVYEPDDRGDPESVATGMVLELGPARFFVTAAHVLDRWHDRPLSANCGATVERLTGEVTQLYSEVAGSPSSDPVDVAMMRLSSSAWEGLPSEQCVTWEQLDHTPADRTERHVHAVVGYPVSKNRDLVQGHQVTSYAYQMLGLERPSSAYSTEGYDRLVNIMIGFEHRHMWGPEGLRTAPKMKGMSGCGIWRVGRSVWLFSRPATLSGVLTEWHPRGRDKFLLGTRIRPIIAALSSQHGDVREFVQQKLHSAA